MKTLSILYLCIFFSLIAFGQKKDISGTYYSKTGTKIEIKEDKFYYIEPHTHNPIWSNDTLAICSFMWVDVNFIELNSPQLDIIRLKGLKINQSSDSTTNDSLKVYFLFHIQRQKLKITVHTNTFKIFELTYSKNNKELMLPNNVKSIAIYIVPEHITPHTSDGQFYGIVGFDLYQEYQIEKNINHISIEIPAIDDFFFEKYYIKNDYAKVTDKTITWKGEVYIKKE